MILTYLAEHSKKFLPRGEDERLEALRWIIFDNQKVNGFLGPYRFLRNFAKPAGHPAVMEFLKGRIDNALGIVDKRLAGRPTFSERSRPSPTCRWSPTSIIRPRNSASTSPATHKNIAAWLDRIKALPGWKHPYDLMPGHPLPQ